ncbi:MAG: 6-phosphofructokinase [Bacteroidetes bacterium]|uniref:ATP-dependent 6-phosphofructokinase n=1 Tax=Phaeocystidibacter marisrubri TaxID=1577780 RepID=A0A6L3ZBP2_9FLAO|nr:6-phosphofructokinase [Phaeocystidibacter marisrubri]KAB2815072.1 6-phosphofructokinase [Phaeocystidibacter marisrubri]TNE27680.1 MAG: 6-phosphofructokinase [Bacteroidota bacterium]GGH70146.1 ATP-dependent 6-phosphofructokinase [Phaeocystidibacter marisrubri]
MSKAIKTLAVLTSGGDAPGMNAAIRAVVRTAVFYEKRIFGIKRGYDGLIEGDFEELNSKSVKNILNLGGTILKSARSEEFKTEAGQMKAYEQLQKHGVDGLIVIGGNGTFTGAHRFFEAHGVPVIGIPGTIDNDLFGTDYTIGYDTATNTVVDCIDKIRDTASSHNRLFFVEVMGRDSGFIAMNTAVAIGALDVILPEQNKSYEDLFVEIEKGASNKKTSNIVVVAEGNKLGDSFSIANKVREHFPQLDTKVTILGHLQRGGAPSCFDRVTASKLGVAAVEGLLNGRFDVMAGMVDEELTYTFLQQAVMNKAQLDPEMLRISKILAI